MPEHETPPSEMNDPDAQSDEKPSDLGVSGSGDGLPDLEPMTLSLMGRLFGVPLMIIGTIVGGAVIVVLAFGGSAAPQTRSIDRLLQGLEVSSGDRHLGVLPPREKELWQAAVELSLRLEDKDEDPELDEATLTEIATRLSQLIQREMEAEAYCSSGGVGEEGARKRAFLIHALGRTERLEAISTLVEVVRVGCGPDAQVAMRMLGDLHLLPDARAGIEPTLARLMDNNSSPETLLVACTVLSVLASGDHVGVIDGMQRVRLANDGEVAWSASVALARLGSNKGKSTLQDMMDRSFLESEGLYRKVDPSGKVHRYKLPGNQIDALMMAAIDASSNLPDQDLWESIEAIKSDPSPIVRAEATRVLSRRQVAQELPAKIKS